VLTASGVAAIAVVRLCGDGVRAFLEKHFTGKVCARAGAGLPVHGRLMDGEREVDDPLVTWDEARGIADVGVHGGTWVVHEVLELARREGFEIVEAGTPLPELAVDAEDVLEREILQYLPLARTKEAIQTLLNQKKAWAELQSTLENRKSEMLEDRSLHWLLHPPRIAIIGVPNAGKSTLANRLFGQQRSIVADLPGTTRDYVEDFANLGGLPVVLVDTPGLRVAADHIESAAIEVSRERIASADLRLLLLDPSQKRGLQEELAGWYPDAIRVSGKADMGVRWEGLRVSATTGEGIAELELAIRRSFHCQILPHHRPCVWTERQRRILMQMP
jgi:tRNA modification GTPase